MATTMSDAPAFMQWSWPDIEPRYAELEARPLSPDTVDAFLLDWSSLAADLDEMGARLNIATTVDTADEEASTSYHRFLDEIYPRVQEAEQRLKEKLLASGLEPAGYAVPLAKMRAEAELFREENLPLQSEEAKLSEEYFKITGAQTVEWEGRELTLDQMRPLLQNSDRTVRERVWRAMTARQLHDREALNDLWRKLLALRRQMASNAGFPDYRAYAWKALQRFDYTPEDAQQIHASIEAEVTPAVARRFERRRQQLGVETLRPWDLEVDPLGRPPLRPFTDGSELREKVGNIFHRVDPQLGSYWETMEREGFLDLENRKNKAPGGYCSTLNAARRPFIFANSVGSRLDVEVMLHEGGHAFHVFEAAHLPYFRQRNINDIGAEFAEVGSMAMEFLAAPYLSVEDGGFYRPEDAARARIEHLEQRVLFLWVRLMVADAFQHWVYEHPDEADDPAACDAVWMDLMRRFIPVVDWSGLDAEMMTGWHNILHIHVAPFYMIEYGLAQLGAVQVWANARQDQAAAVARYRQALSLGDTRSIPDLYEAAGARFAFDAGTIRSAVSLVEGTIEALERV